MKILCHTVLATLAPLSPVWAQRQSTDADARTVAVYDIRDLVTESVVDATPTARLGLPAPSGATSRGHATSAQALGAVVRAFVTPALARDEDVSVVGSGHLAMVGNGAQHAWLERLLQRARRDRQPLARIQTHFLRMPEATFARDVLPVLKASAPTREALEGEPATAVLAPSPVTDAFLFRLRQRAEVEQLQGAELLCVLLQQADVFAGEQISYVRDFEVEVGKPGTEPAFIANPVVDTVEAGVRLSCTAAPLDGGQLGLDIACSVAEVPRPITTVQTTLAGSTQPVSIQLPRQRMARARAAIELSRGQVALLVLPALGDTRHVVTLRADLVTPDAGAPAGAKPVVWTYDVGDLVVGLGDAPVQDGYASPALEGLAAIVRAFADAPVRAAGPSHLVLEANAKQRAWLERFLVDQRALEGSAWTLEPEIATLAGARWARDVLPILAKHGEIETTRGVVLQAGAQTDQLLIALAAAAAEVTALAPVTTARFVRADSTDGLRFTTYVRDHDIKDIDGKEVATPIEDVVRDGPRLTYRATAWPDDRVAVAVEVELMHLTRPIPTFESSTPGGTKITIDLPRVTLTRAQAALSIPPDGLGVVVMPQQEGAPQTLVLLRVRPTAVRRIR